MVSLSYKINNNWQLCGTKNAALVQPKFGRTKSSSNVGESQASGTRFIISPSL